MNEWRNGKDDCNGRLEAATRSGILYIVGQRDAIFISGNSGNFDKWSVETMLRVLVLHVAENVNLLLFSYIFISSPVGHTWNK